MSPATLVDHTHWSGLLHFRFHEKLFEETSEEAWIHITESLYEMNEYEKLAKLESAATAYAVAYKIKKKDVTEKMIESTDLGLEGWAKMSITMDSAVQVLIRVSPYGSLFPRPRCLLRFCSILLGSV